MKWEKQGLVYVPDGHKWWAKTHALLPTVDVLNQDTLRIYFSCLDENQFGRIGFVDLDSSNPSNILAIAEEPVLDVGDIGTFDDCGVVPSSVVYVNGKKYLYYTGFQRAFRVPYMLFTGLAIQNEDQETFKRYSRTPILDRYAEEPFSRGAPFVIQHDGVFKMWYFSCLEWKYGEVIHYNNVIRYATSIDGIVWNVHPHICIKPNFEDEYSIGSPCIIFHNSMYKMWYSIRSFAKGYSAGYAESIDGIVWERRDWLAGIHTSDSGWDSEIICYPVIANTDKTTYMFYNGNHRGRTGFGYAILGG